MAKKHSLQNLIEAVDVTHRGLGRLVALEAMTVKARKLLLVISPHGTGKSAASNFIGRAAPSSLVTDRLSVAGLQTMSDQFDSFTGVVVVDDIAKTQTSYARVSTITTLAELVYSHYISSNLSKLHFEIKDFNGSAIVNIQPVLLDALVASPEWEASIQDKAIRYYHLIRPVEPKREGPKVKLSWGIDITKVELPNMRTKLGQMVMDTARVQWGAARTLEHCTDLVRSAAALDGRKKVNQIDYKLVNNILTPLRVEQIVLDKQGFESDRTLDSTRLAVLTEYYSHGKFTVAQIAEDFHISQSQAYRNMQKEYNDWIVIGKNPTTFGPSRSLIQELTDIGLYNENGAGPKGVQL